VVGLARSVCEGGLDVVRIQARAARAWALHAAGADDSDPVLARVKALAALDPAVRGFGLDTACAQVRGL
jgi:hypothetical protein